MSEGALLALFFVLLTLAFHLPPLTLLDHQSWEGAGVILLWTLLALAAPHPWVGLLFGWLGITLPLSVLGRRWGLIRQHAEYRQQIGQHVQWLLYATVYVLVAHWQTPALQQAFAAGVVGWATVNAGLFWVTRATGWRVNNVQFVPPRLPSALLQAVWYVGWMTAVATLCALSLGGPGPGGAVMRVLAGVHLVTTVACRNSSAGLGLLAGLVVLWPHPLWVPLGAVALVAFAWDGWYRQGIQLRWTSTVQPLWPLLKLARGWPVGVGVQPSYVIQRAPNGMLRGNYSAIHGEPLALLLEVGAPGLLVAGVAAGSLLLTAPGTLGSALVACQAVYALAYFPLRVPGMLLLLAVGAALVA